ncbi:hypothetical protein EH2_02999 [Bacillus subtilis]|nr:hypothetical protein EH2_02999 [Bacillus subtilis]
MYKKRIVEYRHFHPVHLSSLFVYKMCDISFGFLIINKIKHFLDF